LPADTAAPTDVLEVDEYVLVSQPPGAGVTSTIQPSGTLPAGEHAVGNTTCVLPHSLNVLISYADMCLLMAHGRPSLLVRG
jgi:hypothetical protein